MTTQADAPIRESQPTLPTAGSDSAPGAGPRVSSGIRRGRWIVLCVLLLVAVDVIPVVGPYLALAVLMWMVSGLAHAKPAPRSIVRRAERRRRAEAPHRSAGPERGAALPSA
jgi:hypothetical protein